MDGFHERMPPALDAQYVEHREAEVASGLRQGVYGLPPSQDPKVLVSMGYMISPGFFVDKTDKKNIPAAEWTAMSVEEQIEFLRLCVNMKRVNRQVKGKRCRMKGLRGLGTAAQKGVHTHASSWDVKGAYKRVGVHLDFQKFMCIDFGESIRNGPRFVVSLTLPFGYKLSPYLWTRICAKPVAEMRATMPTVIWLDDGLNLHTSWAQGKKDQVEIERILVHWLGEGARHPTKGEGWDESGPVEYVERCLGTSVDLKRGLFLTPGPTVKKIQNTAKQILRSLCRHQRWVGARWIAQFAGLCISTYLSNGQARFRCRAMHDFLVECRVHERGYGVRGKVSRRVISCLEWWSRIETCPQLRRAIWRDPIRKAWATDASKRGHGALDRACPLTALPLGEEMGVPSLGLWHRPEDVKAHITKLELRAFEEKLILSGHEARSSTLLLWEDNAAAVGILNSLSTKSSDLYDVVERIIALLDLYDISLVCRYIASLENPSDWFSRAADKGDWSFAPSVLKRLRLLTRWAPCTVDRFADRQNAVLSRFNSMFPSRGTEALDCFTESWAGEVNWINPPWGKLDAVVYKLACEPDSAAVVIAPRWPQADWYGTLNRLCSDRLTVHDPRGTSSDRLPAHAFVPGPYLAQVGRVPEPLRNRGWVVDAYFVPFRG